MTITESKEPQGLFSRHFDIVFGYLALLIGVSVGLPCFDECAEYQCLGCAMWLFTTGGIGLIVCVIFSVIGIVRQTTIPLERSVARWILLILPFCLFVAAGIFGVTLLY